MPEKWKFAENRNFRQTDKVPKTLKIFDIFHSNSCNFFSQSDALLFYNGPLETLRNDTHIEYSDYIFIQLRGGRISLEVSMNGQSRSSLEVASTALNDGTWHDISVNQEGKRVELVVDNCRFLGAGADDSSCRAELYTPDDDERLNIVTPVQIGGLAPLSGQDYPQTIPRAGLNGCVRNLNVNGDQYDLATPAFEQNSEKGCRLWGATCDSNSVDSLNHCIHGDCFADVQGSGAMVAKCVCDPGWGGARCERRMEWIQFAQGAFIEVRLRLQTRTSRYVKIVDFGNFSANYYKILEL